MIQYIIRRMLVLIPTLIVTTIVIFAIIQLTPGDPIQRFESPENPLTEEERARLYARYGLDKPLPMQYLNWAQRVFTGDLGESFNWNQPVWNLVAKRVPQTVELAGLSLLLSLILAVPIGTLSAIKQYSWVDNTITFFQLLVRAAADRAVLGDAGLAAHGAVRTHGL